MSRWTHRFIRAVATVGILAFAAIPTRSIARALQPSSAPTPTSGQPSRQAEAISAPVVEAAAAVLIESDSGQVLFEKNSHTPMPMASTTKVMTALLALEKGDLNDIVTASERASRIDGTRIYLEPGEKESLRDLLYALMLPSANDAAIAIAEHISGSQEAFVALMNEKARVLGARDTYYQDPHGLSSRGHYTTADDLAQITRVAMRNPVFARIVSTKEYQMPWPVKSSVRPLYNHNKLLWRDLSSENFVVTGVKTGYISEAGNCLVASARQGTREVIAVTLNSSPGAQYRDVLALFRYAFSGFTQHQVVRQGEIVAYGTLANGTPLPVVPDRGLSVSLPPGQSLSGLQKEVEWSQLLQPPVAGGQPVGHLRVLVDGREIGRVGLLSAVAVNVPRTNRLWPWAVGGTVLWGAVVLDKRRRKVLHYRRRNNARMMSPVLYERRR